MVAVRPLLVNQCIGLVSLHLCISDIIVTKVLEINLYRSLREIFFMLLIITYAIIVKPMPAFTGARQWSDEFHCSFYLSLHALNHS